MLMQGRTPFTKVFFGTDCKEDDSSDSDISWGSEYDSSSDVSFEPFSLLSSDDEFDSLSSGDSDNEGLMSVQHYHLLLQPQMTQKVHHTHSQPQFHQKSTQLN